jgi:hypothetical protein
MQPEVVAFMAAVVFAVFKIVEFWIIWERAEEE